MNSKYNISQWISQKTFEMLQDEKQTLMADHDYLKGAEIFE